jgi:UDP-glucose 4-epimerase
VEGTVLSAVSPKALGDVFNIGTGVETSVNVLASEISALFGGTVPIEYVDRRDIDNIRRRALSPEKIRMRLGWIPRVRVKDGLRMTYDWLRSSRAQQPSVRETSAVMS